MTPKVDRHKSSGYDYFSKDTGTVVAEVEDTSLGNVDIKKYGYANFVVEDNSSSYVIDKYIS